jgi:hypothetical protein
MVTAIEKDAAALTPGFFTSRTLLAGLKLKDSAAPSSVIEAGAEGRPTTTRRSIHSWLGVHASLCARVVLRHKGARRE